MNFILKTLRIVKLTVFLILLGLLRVSLPASAQEHRVNLTSENITLGKALQIIREQTKLEFFYSNKELDIHQVVNVRAINEDINKVLKNILGEKYSFRINNNMVIIRRAEQQSGGGITIVRGTVKDTKGLPLVGVTVLLKGQRIGATTDKDGKFVFTIPFNKDKPAVLQFSFVGMETKEEVCKGTDGTGKDWVIVMKDEISELEEVVVNTGYQKVNTRNLTSAVTSVKANDVVVPGLNTIDKMLEGHVPGLILMQNSGQVGATPRLRIRGTSTVLGTQEPLWVVDGIVVTDPVSVSASQLNDLDFVNLLGNAIAGLNPADIDQIDVLKDAAATALYGARAANGVIVITTKKGRVGAPSVRYSFAGSFSPRPHYSDKAVNMMTAAERIDYSREIIGKRLNYKTMSEYVGYEDALIKYYNGEYDFQRFQKEVSWYESLNTDWFDVLTQNSFSHDHSLSISGGSENTRYYASVGYMDQNGVLIGESNKRYTANVSVDMNYKRFNIHFGLQGNVSDKRYTPSEVGLLNYAYNTSRAVPVYNLEGDLWYYKKSGSNGYYNYNILNERDNSYDKINGNSVSLNTTINYNVTDWLKAGATLSYSIDNTYRDTYYGEKTYYASGLRMGELGGLLWANSLLPYGGELKKDDVRKNAYLVRFQVDANKYIDKECKHQVSGSVGGEVSSTGYMGLRQTLRCYIPERGRIFNPVDITKYSDYGKWLATDPEAMGVIQDALTNLASLYVSLSYNYNDRYLLNVNARLDGSNAFGDKSNDMLLPIWSISGRWNLSEDVLKNVSWINQLALRGSFGWQGNMLNEISPELTLLKGTQSEDYDRKYISTIKNFPNPNLRWEKTVSTNFTLDFSFLDNKIKGSFSYYYKKTRDAFLDKSVSEINGITKYVVNKGTLENQGIEVILNFNPISTGNGRDAFNWRFDPQLGQVINKLVNRTVNRDKSLHDEITYSDYLDGNVEVSGRPLNTFYSYKFKGLNPKDGRPLFYDTDQTSGEGLNAVDIAAKYRSMNRDDVFLTVMEHSGTRVPLIQGGLLNTFSYKGFVLSLNLSYSLGSKVRLLKMYPSVASAYGTIAPLPIQNVRKEFVNRWKRPGDENYTNVPGLISNEEFTKTMSPWWRDASYKFAENIWQMYDNSNVRVVSGNYLKLQSMSLRYLLADSFCKKLKMQSIYINLSGTNLFTWCASELRGQDPSQTGNSDNISLSVRPSYSFGIDITF